MEVLCAHPHKLARKNRMEANLREVQSAVLERSVIQNVLHDLSEVVVEAAAIRDQSLVDDPELRRALNIVESFLRRKQRLCYGGMAINAHLDPSMKFYDFSKVLPDYDFFTPEPEEDIKDLVHALESAGFSEVSPRIGIHEGTTKLFVHFTAIADISLMPSWFYNILKKRSIVDDGIHFVDADFLRMGMYLELSRPMGEVERWDKVYKRLVLLNMSKPPHIEACRQRSTKRVNLLPKDLHEKIINYAANEQLMFAGAELERIYAKPKTTRAGFLLKSGQPIVLLTENPEFHLPILRQMIHEAYSHGSISHAVWPNRNDILPELHGIKVNGSIVVLLVKSDYCHSYNTVTVERGKRLRIASLDTAITLWYQLTFVKRLDGLVKQSIHCFADSLVELAMKTRDRGEPGIFPIFSLTCQGHQPTKASLLRAKKARVNSLKRKKAAKNTTRRR